MALVAALVAPSVGPADAPALAAEPAPRPEHAAAADAIERVALLDLRTIHQPNERDYLVAAELFSAAADLAPDDLELAHRIVQAAYASGDADRLNEATRRVVRLDPRDTVAQLRLITAAIASRQTAEDRLAAYERYVGPQGDRLDAALRSRLALDAALLARELGDDDRFARLLARATELDITNKDAAALALNYFDERVDDPIGRFELLLNLLYADPLDPGVHRSIAESLAQQRMWRAAKRFHDNAIQLLVAAGGPDQQTALERRTLTWFIDGPQTVADEFNTSLAILREQATDTVEAKEESGAIIEDGERPENTRLAATAERIRLLAAVAAGDEETIQASLADLAKTNEQLITMTSELMKEGAQPDPNQLQLLMTQFNEVQLARAITGLQANQLAPSLDAFTRLVPGSGQGLRSYLPWVMLRAGNPERALDVIDRSSVVQNQFDLVRGAVMEMMGRNDEAATYYARFAASDSLSSLGAYALYRAETLAPGTTGPTPEGRRMADLAAGVPEWIDKMVRRPSGFMSLKLVAEQTTIERGHPTRLRLRVRNTSPIALAVGADKPVGTRVLLAPGLDVAGDDLRSPPIPEVLELDRRLRLEPRGEIAVDIDPDMGYTGWLFDQHADRALRVRWRAVQNFTPGARGALDVGPLGLADDTTLLLYPPVVAAPVTPTDAARLLAGANSEDLPSVAALVSTVIISAVVEADTSRSPEEFRPLIQAAIERYRKGTTDDRLVLLGALPHGGMSPMMELFDRAAREGVTASTLSTDGGRFEALLVLATRVRDHEAPVLERCRLSSNDRVRAMARYQAERLRTGRRCLAVASAEPSDLAGRVPGVAPRKAEPTAP